MRFGANTFVPTRLVAYSDGNPSSPWTKGCEEPLTGTVDFSWNRIHEAGANRFTIAAMPLVWETGLADRTFPRPDTARQFAAERGAVETAGADVSLGFGLLPFVHAAANHAFGAARAVVPRLCLFFFHLRYDAEACGEIGSRVNQTPGIVRQELGDRNRQ